MPNDLCTTAPLAALHPCDGGKDGMDRLYNTAQSFQLGVVSSFRHLVGHISLDASRAGRWVMDSKYNWQVPPIRLRWWLHPPAERWRIHSTSELLTVLCQDPDAPRAPRRCMYRLAKTVAIRQAHYLFASLQPRHTGLLNVTDWPAFASITLYVLSTELNSCGYFHLQHTQHLRCLSPARC